MKLKGQPIPEPACELVVFPRGETQIAFKARPVNTEQFEKLVAEPKAPLISPVGAPSYFNVDDPDYKEKMDKYGELRIAWMVITSLGATDGLEWDTVKEDDPTTWLNYKDELKASNIMNSEINQLIGAVLTANGLNEARLKEARDRFLNGEAEAAQGK